MRRIAWALVVAVMALGMSTSAQAAAHPKPKPKKACKTIKRKKATCPKRKPAAKPKAKPKPKQPTATIPAPAPVVVPVAPTTPSPSDAGSSAPPVTAAPPAPPAPVGPPSIAVGPAGASTTSPLTVTVANLPAAAPGEHYVVRLIGTSATATQCVFGAEIPDVTAPATVTPNGVWCSGPWQGDLLAMDADGDVDAPIATVTFAIS